VSAEKFQKRISLKGHAIVDVSALAGSVEIPALHWRLRCWAAAANKHFTLP